MRATHFSSLHIAYADDLTIVTKTPKANQKTLDEVQSFLEWTRTMAAKPSKCRSLARKVFMLSSNDDRRYDWSKSYSSYDSRLSIAGTPIPFIADEPFKFLGRRVYEDLDERVEQRKLVDSFEDQLLLIDRDSTSGPQKAWMYRHRVLPSLSWPLMVYDFSLSFGKELQKVANR